jgi:hypothetical protein
MATLALGTLGTSLGAGFGGTIMGMSGATIGGMVGTMAGSLVDSWIIAGLTPGTHYQGERLDDQRVTSSSEGATIPRAFGTVRLGSNVIWATDFREDTETTTTGGKGSSSSTTTTEYVYYCSFALAICEGPISGIGRMWVDGELMDLTDIEYRIYLGSEDQQPDDLIASMMAAGETPAYRSTAYVVFEDMLLTDYGNRIPQITFEVYRALPDDDTLEGQVRAVTLIPSTGEFSYSTQVIETSSEYLNSVALEGRADSLLALDLLQASAPQLQSVSLMCAWFADDLRADQCRIMPGVEKSDKSSVPYSATSPLTWRVNGVDRNAAHLVSYLDGKPAYGGTPTDESMVEMITELKARGLGISFYPFIMLDIPADNSLPDPYSDDAAAIGQPAYPWRGRLTCSPATGYSGSVDRTAEAADQVAAFFGAARASDFSVSGTSVEWSGGSEWGLRRMILHYAHLCAAAGGVEAFVIGSEMRGLTQIRSDASSYPAVSELISLAAEVHTILGDATKITYAADWSEYFGHQPADGSGDVYFHLDPLWADENIDFIGIDNYFPLADWRDGFDHLDARAGAQSSYDGAYLRGNVEGGEGYDWYYPTDAARAGQERSAISDGTGKPWVFRNKDIRGWWSNQHFDRPGGVEASTPSAWVAQSKPVRFTEIGCAAVDRAANQPNVFYDPKSSESFLPHFSRGWRDDSIQRCYLEAVFGYWLDEENNPLSTLYDGRMIDIAATAVWCWDVRPYPFFPNLTDVWSDGENWRLGHWLSGRLGSVSLRALMRNLCASAGLPESRLDVSQLHGAVEGMAISSIESPSTTISTLARYFGFDSCETQGRIRFVSRGRAPVASISTDELVAASDSGGDVLEIVRAQETELALALQWQLTRNDDEYDAIVVESRRITVDSTRVTSEGSGHLARGGRAPGAPGADGILGRA